MRSGVAAKLFAACLGCSLVDLVVLDFVVGPEALRDDSTRAPDAARASESTSTLDAGAAPTAVAAASAPAPRAVLPARRVVARFDSEQPSADDTELRALAAAMLADPSAEIVLEGHSDQRGDPERNRMLSLERAKWAQTRLVELGVSASRIAVVGVGAERPRETGEDDTAVAANRRVEVRWITGTPPSENGDR
jgi:outer membrane protein OmpA-like peptidoglycan-associated protein